MTVKPGDIITMSSFTHVQPTLKAGFKAPHGRLAVFLLLGDVDKKAPDSFDPGAALRMLGWYPESDFGPAEPGTGSIKDRAAELAASMKVMAALHRANEDVAAADEFAQGAELVATMAAEIESLQAKTRISLNLYQIRELLEMADSSGEPEGDELIIVKGDGACHSGPGLYAYFSECPEEGASFIGENEEDQQRGNKLAEEFEAAQEIQP